MVRGKRRGRGGGGKGGEGRGGKPSSSERGDFLGEVLEKSRSKKTRTRREGNSVPRVPRTLKGLGKKGGEKFRKVRSKRGGKSTNQAPKTSRYKKKKKRGKGY